MILAHDANESLIEQACIEDATRRRWRYANCQVSFSTIEHGDRIITVREVTDLQSYARRLVPKYRCQARKDEEGRMIRQAHGRSEEHTSELQSLMRISYSVFCFKQKTVQLTSIYHQSSTITIASYLPSIHYS